MSDFIQIKNIYKSYKVDKNEIPVLHNTSFSIKANEKVAISGASGCGKSTLLSIMSGLEVPTKGEVLYNEMDLYLMNKRAQLEYRQKHFGYIFQSYHLISTLNVIDNIMIPLLANKIAVNLEEIELLCDKLGILHRIHHFPYQLSGGEKQRVAIARALIYKPQVIFSDEATGNLDKKNSIQVMDMLAECCDRNNLTLIYVTHDQSLLHYADRIINLEEYCAQ